MDFHGPNNHEAPDLHLPKRSLGPKKKRKKTTTQDPDQKPAHGQLSHGASAKDKGAAGLEEMDEVFSYHLSTTGAYLDLLKKPRKNEIYFPKGTLVRPPKKTSEGKPGLAQVFE